MRKRIIFHCAPEGLKAIPKLEMSFVILMLFGGDMRSRYGVGRVALFVKSLESREDAKQ